MARTPFYGRNDTKIAKMDMQAATAPGRAYRDAFENLGQQVGGAIEKYQLNKEKREKLTNDIASALRFNPKYAARMTMSGDEESDKKGQSVLDKFVKGDLNMSQLEGLAGNIAMMEKVDLKKQKEEDREIANNYQRALTTSKINENNLFETTKSLTLENKELTNKSKRLENLLKGVEAYIKVESLPEELQSTLRKLNEDIAEADAKRASREAYTPTQRALDEKAQAGATIAKTEQDIRGNKNKNKITPLQDTEGNVVPGSYMINGTPFTQDFTGTLARVGTPSENMGLPRPEKAENLINEGMLLADEIDLTDAGIKSNIAAGGDVGGMFEDALNYVAGKVGVSGEQIDNVVDMGLGSRQEQSKRLNALNMQIRPLLVGSISSKGNVYTQKMVDEQLLAGTKEDNPTVKNKLSEYPTLLNIAYVQAKSTLRDPEVKPGTSVYEKAKQIVLTVPGVLKRVNASIGILDQYDMDPSFKRIMGNSQNRSTPVVDSNISEVSDIDLLKLLK
jgi:hypothetical protein